MTSKIPVLFVHKNSTYKQFPQFDCWDYQRNALLIDSQVASIYHPPCRLFSRLRGLSTAPACEKLLAYWSIARVRRFCGILYHPYDSRLFKEFNISKVGSFDEFGGTFIVVDQFDFGFYTRKRTGLYIVGLSSVKQIPRLPLRFESIVRKFSNLTSKQRSESVPGFIEFLEKIINEINLCKTKQ